MKKYIEALSEMNAVALSSSDDELERYAESDIFWTKHRDGKSAPRTIHKGDIYQFEFGKNYVPEMAYEHRGLVIGASRRLLYVLPIYSYKPGDHKVPPAHIVDNPDAGCLFYLLKQCEFSFLKHDSVVKLNDIRTVSEARIKYSHKSSIPSATDTYAFIEKAAFRHCFPSVSFAYDRLKSDFSKEHERAQILERENEELIRKMEALEARRD